MVWIILGFNDEVGEELERDINPIPNFQATESQNPTPYLIHADSVLIRSFYRE